jgi:hypothetical protein
MSALYTIRYHGVAGYGHGALYIGHGKIFGVGIDDNRYDGAYAQHGVNLVGQASLTAKQPTLLVTGKSLQVGEQAVINFTLPPTFANGQPITVIVDGSEVVVSFDKVRDIP